MTKKAFSQYVHNQDACESLSACLSEIEREIVVRKRLYDRWVAEGKCTWQEADDRMRRLMGAHMFLMQGVSDDFEIKMAVKEQAVF